MAKGEGKAAWRWNKPAAEEPPTPQNGPARSRWGSDTPNQTESATKDNALFPAQPRPGRNPAPPESTGPQEPGLFSSLPTPPPASFPPLHMQLDTATEKERWERSHSWLEHLDQPDAPANTAAQPAHLEKPQRAQPAHLEKPQRAQPAPPRKPRSRKKSVISVLLAALAVLLAAALIVAGVPGLRARALSLLPSSQVSTANPTQGTLIAQSSTADATLTIAGQHYDISQSGKEFWSVSVPLNPGAYTLTIAAPNYSPASGQVHITAKHTQTVTALLSLSPGMLTTLTSSTSNSIAGQPLAQGVPGGAQYTGGQTASQSLTVTINYRVVSIISKPGPSVLVPGTVTSVPQTLVSGVVTPDIVFSTSGGASAAEYRPGPLPAANFLVSLRVLFDASGQPFFALGNPAALTVTSSAGTPLTAPGGVNADLALLYALTQASLTQGNQAGSFTCIGLADAVNGSSAQPDPEDGLMMGQSGSAAHYFYRWGQLWTTNSAAQALNPNLPQANANTLVLAQSLINAQQAGQPTGCK